MVRRTPAAAVRRSTAERRSTAATPPSQRVRKRREEAFGLKMAAAQKKIRSRGRDRVAWAFTFAAAAYNLVRLPKAHRGAVMIAPAGC